MTDTGHVITPTPPHPRVLGWFGTTALAMGGSNQMIFLIAALFVGQGDILGQGSAAVPLLIVGVLLGWAAAPAWTELVLMWPNRVGGISARLRRGVPPLQPGALGADRHLLLVGLGADLRADGAPLGVRDPAMVLCPHLPVEAVAIAHRPACSPFVNLCGVKWVARLAIPIATASATLAFLSSLIPIFARRGRLAAGVRPFT